jgi:mannose-6-phosphate isomerase-like protein (cupin superfamily)
MYNNYWAYPNPYFNNMNMYNPYNMYYGYYTYPNNYLYTTPMYHHQHYNQYQNQYHNPYHNQQNREFEPYYVPFEDEEVYGFRADPQQQTAIGGGSQVALKDYGPQPYTVNINEATKQNNTFRTALWTGRHLQVTLMSINVGDSIGLEIHPSVDQFLRIEQGQGIVRMGKTKEKMDFQANVADEFAIMVPAGTWHNVINTGNVPLKLYSIYAPPQHPQGTVHVTKANAEAAEKKSTK